MTGQGERQFWFLLQFLDLRLHSIDRDNSLLKPGLLALLRRCYTV